MTHRGTELLLCAQCYGDTGRALAVDGGCDWAESDACKASAFVNTALGNALVRSHAFSVPISRQASRSQAFTSLEFGCFTRMRL